MNRLLGWIRKLFGRFLHQTRRVVQRLRPFSVWSNAFYLLPMLPLYGIGTPAAYIAIGACLSLTLGSGAYHYIGQNNTWGHRWDEVSMYAVILALGLVAASLVAWPAWLSVGLLPVVLLLGSRLEETDSFLTIPVLALAAAVPTWFAVGPWTLLPALLLLGAFYVRQSAHPEERDHGPRHGWWHVGAASALLAWAVLLWLRPA